LRHRPLVMIARGKGFVARFHTCEYLARRRLLPARALSTVTKSGGIPKRACALKTKIPYQDTVQPVSVTNAMSARPAGCRGEIDLRGPILQPKPSDFYSILRLGPVDEVIAGGLGTGFKATSWRGAKLIRWRRANAPAARLAFVPP
jgi:hypothetical protein